MLKTFIVGILLGIAGAAAALYAIPAVDQYREASIVTVAANGGNIESFHVNVPMDRILVRAPGQKRSLPQGMEWPNDPKLDNIRAELFKIRNERDAVIGVASRISAPNGSDGVVDWVLHLPARGSMFINLRAEANENGIRSGNFRAGSREFLEMTGTVTERWVPGQSGDEDEPAGRIELLTTYTRMQEAP